MSNILNTLQSRIPKVLELGKEVTQKDEFAKGERATFYHGTRMKDGSTVAIKRIYDNKPSKDEIKTYAMEIQAIFATSTPYSTSLIGYSVTAPFIIVTECYEEANLSTLLKQKKLDFTQLNSILLELAFALKQIHEVNFIHGNVCPSNIILDKYGKTKLVGFGNSRYPSKSPKNVYTSGKIKENNWLSPEFLAGEVFTEKHDVFSFGSLVYQFLTGEIPFNGQSQSEVRSNIVNYKLPTIPNTIPQQLSKLITDCWDKPDKRPSIAKILESLRSKEIVFPDVNNTKLDVTIQTLLADEEEMFTQKYKGLVHTDAAHFKDELKNVIPEPKSPYVPIFFREIKKLFVKKTSSEIFSYLLDACQALISKTKNAESFCSNHLHLRLPLDRDELIDQGLDIIYAIVINYPNALNSEFSPFIKYLMRKKPEKVIIIASELAKKVDEVDDPLLVLDAVMTSWKYVKDSKSLAAPFLSLFYFLCKKVPDYKNQRGQLCSSLFNKFLDSKSKTAVCVALTGLQFVEAENLSINPEQALDLLKDGKTAPTILSLMLSLDTIDINDEDVFQDIIDVLLKRSQKSNRASLLLCKIASEKNGAELLMKDDSWLCNKLPTVESTFRIALVAMRHPNIMNQLKDSENFKYLLYKCCKPKHQVPLRSIIEVMKAFGIKSDKDVSVWEDCGVLRMLLNGAVSSGEEKSLCHILTFFSDLAFLKEMPMLVDLVDVSVLSYKKFNNVASHVIPLFANISRIPKCGRRIEETRALEVLNQEFKKKEFAKFGTIIRKNIRSSHLPRSTH